MQTNTCSMTNFNNFKLVYGAESTKSDYVKYHNGYYHANQHIENTKYVAFDADQLEASKKPEPHQEVIDLFELNCKAIDVYMEKLNLADLSTREIKKVEKNLTKVLVEAETYMKVSLAASCEGWYSMFRKLFNYRTGSPKNPEFDVDQCKDINDLVRATNDMQRRFFKGIDDLREEINSSLVKLQNWKNIRKDTMWKHSFKSFGSHQIFALYASKIKSCLAQLQPYLDNIKKTQKAAEKANRDLLVICSCGIEVKRNYLPKHPSTVIHKQLMEKKTICEVISTEPEKRVEPQPETSEEEMDVVNVSINDISKPAIKIIQVSKPTKVKIVYMPIQSRFVNDQEFIDELYGKPVVVEPAVVEPAVIEPIEQKEPIDDTRTEWVDEEQEAEDEHDFNDLIVDISKMEKKKAPDIDKYINKLRNPDTKYLTILRNDEDVMNRKRIIISLLKFKTSLSNGGSRLIPRIDEMVYDKRFEMFKSIKQRYGIGIPNEQLIKDEGQLFSDILKHPKVSEVF